jgi:hypothetical protein
VLKDLLTMLPVFIGQLALSSELRYSTLNDKKIYKKEHLRMQKIVYPYYDYAYQIDQDETAFCVRLSPN